MAARISAALQVALATLVLTTSLAPGAGALIPELLPPAACIGQFPPVCPENVEAPDPGEPPALEAPALPEPALPDAGETADQVLAICGTFGQECGTEPPEPELFGLDEAAKDTVREVAARALPQSPDEQLLVGVGQAFVQINGGSEYCAGPSTIVIEASNKAFGLEPTVTMWYGGSEGSPPFALACLMGQTRQPVRGDLQGNFDGAWSGSKSFPTYHWTLTVGEPDENGDRAISYHYVSNDGAIVHIFEGIAAEYR